MLALNTLRAVSYLGGNEIAKPSWSCLIPHLHSQLAELSDMLSLVPSEFLPVYLPCICDGFMSTGTPTSLNKFHMLTYSSRHPAKTQSLLCMPVLHNPLYSYNTYMLYIYWSGLLANWLSAFNLKDTVSQLTQRKPYRIQMFRFISIGYQFITISLHAIPNGFNRYALGTSGEYVRILVCVTVTVTISSSNS